ncbi:hypothetical protein ACIPJN_38750 [Streptomyces sp. NPDC086796]
MTALPQRRVYGSDHDDPDPYEQPGREYVEPGEPRLWDWAGDVP